MINVMSIQSDEPNIELVTVCYEETLGGTCLISHIVREDLDAPQQAVYDNFMGLLGGTWEDAVSNTSYKMDIDRATSAVLVEGKTEVDYSVDWDATQQGYADAFLQLAVDLTDAE